MLNRYRTWRDDHVDQKQGRCSHEHLSRHPDTWYWYQREYKTDDPRYGSERYGCIRCGNCGEYRPCSPPVLAEDLECLSCFLPIREADFYFGALKCADCDQLIPCAHKNREVDAHQYGLTVFNPRLECADCGMPIQDPDMLSKDGAICSYEGFPEYDNTFKTPGMNPSLRKDGSTVDIGEGVYVQMNVIGDTAEADRCLNAMEQATGLHGEHNQHGRLYAVEGENLSKAADRIAAHLPEGWQDHLEFVL